MEKNLTKLDRKFRYGKDRGKKGNSFLKRLEGKDSNSTKPFSCKRKLSKGIHTNALSDLLVERISTTEEDEAGKVLFKVSFKKQPLVGKCFYGIEIGHVHEVITQNKKGKLILKKMEDLNADLQHIGRELAGISNKLQIIETSPESDAAKDLDETSLRAAREKYEDQHSDIVKQIQGLAKAAEIAKKSKSRSPVIKKKKPQRLRVVSVVEKEAEFNAWVCLAMPA